MSVWHPETILERIWNIYSCCQQNLLNGNMSRFFLTGLGCIVLHKRAFKKIRCYRWYEDKIKWGRKGAQIFWECLQRLNYKLYNSSSAASQTSAHCQQQTRICGWAKFKNVAPVKDQTDRLRWETEQFWRGSGGYAEQRRADETRALSSCFIYYAWLGGD